MEVELLSDTFSRAGDTFKLFNFSTPVMYPAVSTSVVEVYKCFYMGVWMKRVTFLFVIGLSRSQ